VAYDSEGRASSFIGSLGALIVLGLPEDLSDLELKHLIVAKSSVHSRMSPPDDMLPSTTVVDAILSSLWW
jgi:hypothetical protein